MLTANIFLTARKLQAGCGDKTYTIKQFNAEINHFKILCQNESHR